jgi:hypothetical protein
MKDLQRDILDKWVKENNEKVVSEKTNSDGLLIYNLEPTRDDEGCVIAFRYINYILIENAIEQARLTDDVEILNK